MSYSTELVLLVKEVIAASRGGSVLVRDRDAMARILRLLASVAGDGDMAAAANLYEQLSGANAARGGLAGK